MAKGSWTMADDEPETAPAVTNQSMHGEKISSKQGSKLPLVLVAGSLLALITAVVYMQLSGSDRVRD